VPKSLFPQSLIYVTLLPNILAFSFENAIIKETHINILAAHDEFACALVDTIHKLTLVDGVLILQVAETIELVVFEIAIVLVLIENSQPTMPTQLVGKELSLVSPIPC
jgi:hypothetical protein